MDREDTTFQSAGIGGYSYWGGAGQTINTANRPPNLSTAGIQQQHQQGNSDTVEDTPKALIHQNDHQYHQQQQLQQQLRRNKNFEPQTFMLGTGHGGTFLGEDDGTNNSSNNMMYGSKMNTNDNSNFEPGSTGTNHQGLGHSFAPNDNQLMMAGNKSYSTGSGAGCGHTCNPIRVLLVRHGEAQGNVDRSVYNRLPDHAIPLTENGKEMARRTGKAVHQYFKNTFQDRETANHHFRVLVSPFKRTRQTAECILEGLRDAQIEDNRQQLAKDKQEREERLEEERLQRKLRGEKIDEEEERKKREAFDFDFGPPAFWIDSIRESPFLAEQDFGALEGQGKLAEDKYADEVERMRLQRNFLGAFWARAPHGESYFQVCNRLVGVISDIVNAAKQSSITSTRQQPVRTVIVVTHGVTLRAFLSVWCHYSPEWLSSNANPPNCAVRLLEGSIDRGYIHGGWDKPGDFEKYPDGLPVESIRSGNDPSKETWGNVLGRIRSRSETLSELTTAEKKTTNDDKKTEETVAPVDNSSITRTRNQLQPKAAGSWLDDDDVKM